MDSESVLPPPGTVWVELSGSTTIGKLADDTRREALAFLAGGIMIVTPFLTAFKMEG